MKWLVFLFGAAAIAAIIMLGFGQRKEGAGPVLPIPANEELAPALSGRGLADDWNEPRRGQPGGPTAYEVIGTAKLRGNGWPERIDQVTIIFRNSSAGVTLEVLPDSNGEWRATLPAQDYELEAISRGGRRSLQVLPELVSVKAASESPSITILPLPVVRGTVVDCLGNALVGVSVRVRDGPGATTDSHGDFVIGPMAGVSSATVLVDETTLPFGVAAPWWQALPNHFGESHIAEVGIEGPPLKLLLGNSNSRKVFVIDSNGQPIKDITISLRGRFSPNGEIAGPNFVFRTDERGEGKLSPIYSGAYEARVYTRVSGSKVNLEPIQLAVGCDSSPLTLVFSVDVGPGSLSLRAGDIVGQPIESLLFGVWSEVPGDALPTSFQNHVRASLRTGPDGLASVAGLKLGNYVVTRVESETPISEHVFLDRVDLMRVSLSKEQDHQLIYWDVDHVLPARLRGRVDLASLGVAAEEVVVRVKSNYWPDRVISERLFVERGSEKGIGTFQSIRLPPGPVEILLQKMQGLMTLTSYHGTLVSGEELVVDLPEG